MAKKTRKGANKDQTNEKSSQAKPKSQISDHLLKFLGVAVLIFAVYYAQTIKKENETKVENVSFSTVPPLVDVNSFGDYKVERVTKKVTYDEEGFVVGRKRAEVELMPASEASKFAVEDPTKLSPFVKFLPGPPMNEKRERAMGARFRNFFNFDLTMWWDDGTEKGVYSGLVVANGNSATNTYTTHKFFFRNKATREVVARFTMSDDQHLYFIGPAADDKETLQSERYLKSLQEVQFMKEYHAKNGVPWLSHFPRGPPQLFLYPTDFVGQVHKIKSFIGYHESPTKQSEESITLNVTVVSTKPRVLLIENLMNDFEVDHVIRLGEKVVKQSLVGSAGGGFTSKTRTSENGWLKRSQSTILDAIYYRFADVLQMTDLSLKDDTGSAENLQFVRYLENQRYDPHHDFGYTGRTEQRFSTLLLYLEVPEDGGGTSFPKAFDGKGIQVKPSKGDAVLFYSMLPDGNGDDFSLHAGMPVNSGRKYICNLWSWDPKFR